MFNYDYIQQQAQQQKDIKNFWQIQDSAKKLRDFLDSVEKIDIEYSNFATAELCSILFNYIQNHK